MTIKIKGPLLLALTLALPKLAWDWIKRLFCRHDWKTANIEWDGTPVYECRRCGKIRRVSL